MSRVDLMGRSLLIAAIGVVGAFIFGQQRSKLVAILKHLRTELNKRKTYIVS